MEDKLFAIDVDRLLETLAVVSVELTQKLDTGADGQIELSALSVALRVLLVGILEQLEVLLHLVQVLLVLSGLGFV